MPLFLSGGTSQVSSVYVHRLRVNQECVGSLGSVVSTVHVCSLNQACLSSIQPKAAVHNPHRESPCPTPQGLRLRGKPLPSAGRLGLPVAMALTAAHLQEPTVANSTGLQPTRKCFTALKQYHTFHIRKGKLMKSYQYYSRIQMIVAYQSTITFKAPPLKMCLEGDGRLIGHYHLNPRIVLIAFH